MIFLLAAAVAVVWGIIVYRVFFNEPIEEQGIRSPSRTEHEPYDQYVVKNDTARLALNYRDPFLGTPATIASKDTITPIVSATTPVQKNIPPPLNWETIRYNGFITNPVTKKMVAILSVNGAERMTIEGETFQGVKLLKNKRDSILVSWMGKQKYIKQ